MTNPSMSIAVEDKMSMSEYVRKWIKEALEHDKLNGISTDEQIQIVQNWLNAWPIIPKPDWNTAPKWANWWAVNANGVAFWYGAKPHLSTANGIKWKLTPFQTDQHMRMGNPDPYAETLYLRIGVDWRLTLSERPETI